jgi:hypothetical protein
MEQDNMKTPMKTLALALGLVAALAVSALGVSFAQTSDPNCIQQYDSSGTPTEPYCHGADSKMMTGIAREPSVAGTLRPLPER